jgi:hypothetical protein
MVDQAGRAERLKDGVNMTTSRSKTQCFKCYIKKIKDFSMDEVKVCVDGHIIYMSYYNSQDLAHTADSAGKPEGDFLLREFQDLYSKWKQI